MPESPFDELNEDAECDCGQVYVWWPSTGDPGLCDSCIRQRDFCDDDPGW